MGLGFGPRRRAVGLAGVDDRIAFVDGVMQIGANPLRGSYDKNGGRLVNRMAAWVAGLVAESLTTQNWTKKSADAFIDYV